MKDKRIHCVPNIHFEDHPYFGSRILRNLKLNCCINFCW